MANIEKLKTLLESFWLENSEAITYLEYLKMGTKPASVIANKLWIWRTTIIFNSIWSPRNRSLNRIISNF